MSELHIILILSSVAPVALKIILTVPMSTLQLLHKTSDILLSMPAVVIGTIVIGMIAKNLFPNAVVVTSGWIFAAFGVVNVSILLFTATGVDTVRHVDDVVIAVIWFDVSIT